MKANLTRISYYTYDPEMLVNAREDRELSVQDVAEGTNLDRATVWRVMTGRAASYESVEAICVFLNLRPSEVMQQSKGETRGKNSKKISASVALNAS